MPSISFISAVKNLRPSPFLLALSGGPDSMALFHLLLELKKPFAVAHVDHRWRKESAKEAEYLQEMAEKAGVFFHLKVLDPKKLFGNLEQACREARYQFFSEICKEYSYSGVILGHHQDDLAETVLKRILEGASFASWTGMLEISKREGLTLFRPWLQIPKKEILEFLKEREISFFTDPTNESSEFLRGRMRSKMIPEIEEHLGKSIRGPLARLSKESQDLNTFMQDKWASKLRKVNWVDLSAVKTPFEMRYVVKQWVKNHGLDVSYAVLDDATEFLLNGAIDKSFILKDYVLEVDRKRLFLRLPFKQSAPISLTEGKHKWGSWNVEVKKVAKVGTEKTGPKAAFKGDLKVYLPEDEYTLKNLTLKEWSEAKIPVFLRRMVPVIVKNDKVVREFFLKSNKLKGLLCIKMEIVQQYRGDSA